MSVPDAVLAAVVAALPDARLYDNQTPYETTDLVVFDGMVPKTPPARYVVVYIDNGTRRAVTMANRSDELTFRWTQHCIAPDRGMAAWLSNRIADDLIDSRLTVSGWSLGPVRHDFSQQPQREEVVMERPIVNAIDQFSMLTQRL